MGNAIQNEADHHPASDSGKTTDKKAPVSEVAEAKQKTGFYKRWNDGMVNLKLLDKKHSQKLFFDEDDIDVEEAMENEINAAWTLMSFALYSKNYAVCVQLMCSIVARLTLFIGLLISQFNYAGFCPTESSSGMVNKIIYFGICILYTGRLTSNFLDLERRKEKSTLHPNLFQMLDAISKTYFNNAVYLLNIVVVAESDCVLDMILNSIAMEFLTQIDDEVKERVINSCFGDDFRKLFPKYIKETRKIPEMIVNTVRSLAYLIEILAPLFFLGVGIYGLNCIPSDALSIHDA